MIYGDGLLTVTPEGITIDTGLSAREAGQAKLSQYQTEQGTIIQVSDDGIVTYSNWSWTGSHEDIAAGRKNYSVFVDGEAFDGKPLLDIMQEADNAADKADEAAFRTAREKLRKALNALSAAVEDAAGKDRYLPDNGPLGTLIADDGRILLLPENIFLRALGSRSDRDSSKFAGCWKNTGLQGLDGWRFTLACYAYRYCSGRTPFPQEDPQLRVSDYFDKNFIPLEWYCTLKGVPGDDSEKVTASLYKIIAGNLSKAAPVQETAKQKKKAAKRSAIEMSQSAPLPELPSYESRENANFALTNEYMSQQKKLKKTRFIRKNSLAIKWGSIGALVILFFVVSFIKDKLNVPTTKGMEPRAVLEMFYDSFEQLDGTHFDAAHAHGCADNLSNYLSTMFVTSKMRQSYESMGHYTVNQWINTKVLSGTFVFGLSHLTFTPISPEPPVDGPADTEDEFSWIVTYNIVYNMGNDEFSYIKRTDLVTITWRLDRWLITDFETVENTDYEDAGLTLVQEAIALQPEEYTVNQGAYLLSQLKDKYPWLPTEAEVQKGMDQLITGWHATEYQKVIDAVLPN